jgi:hypothetical protein
MLFTSERFGMIQPFNIKSVIDLVKTAPVQTLLATWIIVSWSICFTLITFCSSVILPDVNMHIIKLLVAFCIQREQKILSLLSNYKFDFIFIVNKVSTESCDCLQLRRSCIYSRSINSRRSVYLRRLFESLERIS